MIREYYFARVDGGNLIICGQYAKYTANTTALSQFLIQGKWSISLQANRLKVR